MLGLGKYDNIFQHEKQHEKHSLKKSRETVLKFSEHFNCELDDSDDWFDLLLNVDTKLFIDPFLIYSSEYADFIGSHAEIVSFFNTVFQFIARSEGNEASVFWKKALGLLLFPEAEEFKLGYAGKGRPGAGSGQGFAKVIAGALWESIEAGVEEITHFEQVGILREGIGADRISDITATILRQRFVNYTYRIANGKNIPIKKFTYRRGKYDPTFQRWKEITCELPVNPNNKLPILLTPKRYIRDLPTISANNFWDYCYSNENEILRNDFSFDTTSNVDKKTIVDLARKHPELRKKYLKNVESTEPDPYNFEEDKRGVVNWYNESSKYCEEYPLRIVFQNKEEFISSINLILEEFKNYIRNNGGWSLLWNDDGKPKSEEACQFLLQGIVTHRCRACNIDISREVNIGRGPVDFKVSQGYDYRALLELKLAKNSKFWNGLTKQLPKYQEAEGVNIGYFIVVLQTENDLKRLTNIRKYIDEVNQSTGYQIKHVVIDARKSPPSASKL
jgi:hypothetical protein